MGVMKGEAVGREKMAMEKRGRNNKRNSNRKGRSQTISICR
jgi:hypothetical protein